MARYRLAAAVAALRHENAWNAQRPGQRLDDLRALGPAIVAMNVNVRCKLTYVVKHLARAAAPHSCTADGESLSAVQPQGWGQLRCVTFTPGPGAIPVPGNLPSVDWDGPIKVDMRSADLDGVQALVFRLGGGPYIKRPADLALGWVCAADGSMDRLLSVDLVLAEQLELVNVTVDTVAAIKMVAA